MSNGWAKIGLIIPSTNTVCEIEWRQHLPPGVSFHTSRMRIENTGIEGLEQLEENYERAGELLRTANVDVLAYGCTTGSLYKGMGFEKEIEKRLSEVAGCPAVSTAASVTRALDRLGLEEIVVWTPYVEEFDKRVEQFLTDSGYGVVDMGGSEVADPAASCDHPPLLTYRQVMDLDQADADGIFISCTNNRTFDVIEPLEDDLEKPVISSNLATLWDALQTIGVEFSKVGIGKLCEV